MIYLMRHAESVVNIERRITCRVLAGDLTPLGKEQALKAALWLRDKKINAIYYSPFHHAVQTAQIIGDFLGVAPVEVDDLREMDCGELEGRDDRYSWGILSSVFGRWKAGEWDARYPGGESLSEGFKRFSRVLARIGENQNALLVTHGGITRGVVPYLCVNAAALQRLDQLHHTGFVVLDRFNPTRYACEAWNLIDHLV